MVIIDGWFYEPNANTQAIRELRVSAQETFTLHHTAVTAEALGDFGARVLICARKDDELQSAAARLQERGISVDWLCVDAGKPESIAGLVETAMERLGNIDILVNNAGASWGAPAEDYPLDAWDKGIKLPLSGRDGTWQLLPLSVRGRDMAVAPALRKGRCIVGRP